MKNRKVIIVSILTVILAATVYGISVDVIEQLSLQRQSANLYILNDFAGDWTSDGNLGEDSGADNNWQSVGFQLKQFQIPNSRTLSAIVKGDKVGAAKELCSYVKQYVGSREFLDAYNAKREKAKPTTEPSRPDAATIKSQKDSLRETEANLVKMKRMKMLTTAQIAQIEKGLADMRKQITEWDDPTPNKTRWQKNYPEDVSILVKQRLEEYLATVATVDFNATLTPAGRKQKFTNPAYENQSLKWKAIYRAGKDVNDAVTVFVKDWLKEGVNVAGK